VTIDRRWYLARINKVIDHIDAHLAEPLNLGALAAVARVSPWHFHRVFQALTGETLAARVRRRRLEVAASRLLATPPVSALAIALDVGFASAPVFTRAFKAHFGVTPTGWRRGGSARWMDRQRAAMRRIHRADHRAARQSIAGFVEDGELWPSGPVERSGAATLSVTVKTLPETRVAYLRHVGPYGGSGITRTWQRFAAWCAAHGLMQPRRRMFGISHDSPDLTAPERCRYDACVEVEAAFQPQDDVGVQIIPAGRHAITSFAGTAAEIHQAWMRFLGDWLPDSRYQCDDRPALELYQPDFRIDPRTGAFTCWLCIPVRPL
jgi:AraC family transcriptional regulator